MTVYMYFQLWFSGKLERAQSPNIQHAESEGTCKCVDVRAHNKAHRLQMSVCLCLCTRNSRLASLSPHAP